MVSLLFMRRGSSPRPGREQDAFVLSGNQDARQGAGQVFVPYLPWHGLRASGPSPRGQPKGGMNNRRAASRRAVAGVGPGSGATGGVRPQVALGAGLTPLGEARCTYLHQRHCEHPGLRAACPRAGHGPSLSPHRLIHDTSTYCGEGFGGSRRDPAERQAHSRCLAAAAVREGVPAWGGGRHHGPRVTHADRSKSWGSRHGHECRCRGGEVAG